MACMMSQIAVIDVMNLLSCNGCNGRLILFFQKYFLVQSIKCTPLYKYSALHRYLRAN